MFQQSFYTRTQEYFKLYLCGIGRFLCESTEEEQRTMTIVSHTARTHSLPFKAAANNDVISTSRCFKNECFRQSHVALTQ